MTLYDFYLGAAHNMVVGHGGKEHVCDYHRAANNLWIKWMTRTWERSGRMTLDQFRMAMMVKNEGRAMHPFLALMRVNSWQHWTDRENIRMLTEEAFDAIFGAHYGETVH